jgi:hypothetical protein
MRVGYELPAATADVHDGRKLPISAASATLRC